MNNSISADGRFPGWAGPDRIEVEELPEAGEAPPAPADAEHKSGPDGGLEAGGPGADRGLHVVPAPRRQETRPQDLPAAKRGLDAGDLEAGQVEPGPADTGVPIDPPATPQSSTERLAAAQRRELPPVLPTWAATRAARRSTGRWAGKWTWHQVRYWMVHAIPQLLVWGWWALRGIGRITAGLGRFIADSEGRDLRTDAVGARDRKAYLLLVRERNARVARRSQGIAVLAVLAAIVGAGLWAWAPAWLLVVVAAGLYWVLARAGKPAGVAMVGPNVVRRGPPKVTSTGIANAFAALGISAISQLVKAGRGNERFVNPIQRVAIGWMAPMELPEGVTAEQVIAKRKEVASGMRRQIGAVWPMERRDLHPGALDLWVLDGPFSSLPMPAWPLLKGGKVSMLGAIPFGRTQNMEPAAVTMFESNLLTGGIQGVGKTSGLLVVGGTAALDVRCRLILIELKGSGDYSGLRPVAHRYVSGPGDDEHLDAVMAILRELHADVDARGPLLAKAIQDGRAPDRKVTEQLADTIPGLRPLLLIIDEIAELFASKRHAAEAEQLLLSIMRRGRALAVMVALGIQNPDSKSIPLTIVRLIGTRYALRVDGQIPNDAILGTSAYQAGHRANIFDETDRGVGLLKVGTNVRTVRSYYLTVDQVAKIGARAHALRTAAGTLTGDAAGAPIPDPGERTQVVIDAIETWAAAGGDDSAWLHALEDALAQRHPDRYAGLEQPWLGARLRALSIPTQEQRKRRVDGEQINRAGVALSDLREALEAPTG